jgi:ParB family transcriptional regulator, chromosome partitioning protein
MMGRASAANVLGITVRELDKLVEVFELSEKFKSLRDPSAAITWARELMGVSKKLLTPSVVETVVKQVNQKRVTNSKDLRKLRAILRDPVARTHFLNEQGDIDSSHAAVDKPRQRSQGLRVNGRS